MISASVERNDFKWCFERTCFRYSDGTMSTAVNKVEEQVSASKPQQNGHERNKSEELQLEDMNDNNNDEVIFRDIFLRVGVSKCRSCKKIAPRAITRAISTLALRATGGSCAVKLQARYRLICDIMDPIVVVSLWVIQGRIRIPDWIFFLILLEINNANVSNANDDKAPLDFYTANDTLFVRISLDFQTTSLSGLRIYIFNRIRKVLLSSKMKASWWFSEP